MHLTCAQHGQTHLASLLTGRTSARAGSCAAAVASTVSGSTPRKRTGASSRSLASSCAAAWSFKLWRWGAAPDVSTELVAPVQHVSLGLHACHRCTAAGLPGDREHTALYIQAEACRAATVQAADDSLLLRCIWQYEAMPRAADGPDHAAQGCQVTMLGAKLDERCGPVGSSRTPISSA